ncbi:MAG: Lrp/AsnC family transcriptional regulator [Candidatus Omnitrophica bacterium]|nr:Lrp/AsnC family transcriptional regulator [bacterium]MBV6483473.1 Regulatory protein AsnC [bacterium]MCC6733577.1 Lrp/AsnC family transcriptional regulator [Candidatus Omnitrophota bacterium]MCE7908587.1 Lrp/AsnC family transcriptional regulator [Candidatus Omnitrophica bacterium COP1]MCL4735602.1 Lrp/AsnC family transcriptional regulator [Candidatus Omnitrophota bacterium]
MAEKKKNTQRSLDEQILELLEQNARLADERIADLLGVGPSEIHAAIKRMEDEKVILGYRAVTDPAKTSDGKVTCMIEVRVTPQRGVGFDKIAERIYRFPEVRSLYLVSGAYDLLVVVEGHSIQDVSYFVFEKLATLEHIQSTSTHFMLKKYKDNGIILGQIEKVERLPVTP